MIGRISGLQVGNGMSLFMAAGELSRTVGPLIAVWAVTNWTLDGIYRLVVLGWVASLLLYWRLRSIPARSEKAGNLRAILPALRTLYLPLLTIVFFRNFLNVSLTTYLPTYMNSQGATLIIAGVALSILELAGVAGALLSGTMSDRMGRKPILIFATLTSAIFMLFFLNAEGWLLVPLLLALGFTTLSTTPVLLAVVQEQFPNNRALANGLFLSMAFLIRSFTLLAIGYLGDLFGLETAYLISALISLLAIPAILRLPQAQILQP
jgi:FSR family fosmidomycin resistance protein-like MFS transporter